MTNSEQRKRRELESRDEVRKLLGIIYFEWSRVITEDLISFWLQNLRENQITKGMARAAAQHLAKQKTFGEPKFSDFFQSVLALFGERDQPYFDPRSSATAMSSYLSQPLKLPRVKGSGGFVQIGEALKGKFLQ